MQSLVYIPGKLVVSPDTLHQVVFTLTSTGTRSLVYRFVYGTGVVTSMPDYK
jgi:hypothetical protein